MIQLLDVYFKFMKFDILVSRALGDVLDQIRDMNHPDHSNPKPSFQQNHIHNLCPTCFYQEDGAGEIHIAIDGNFCHCKYKDRGSHNLEKCLPQILVHYGNRDYGLSGAKGKAWNDNVRAGGENCKNTSFTAAKDPKSDAPSKKARRIMDETGLMVATCRHGIGIRMLNIYGTGERHSHGRVLIEVTSLNKCLYVTIIREAYCY